MFESPEAFLLLGLAPFWVSWWRGQRILDLEVGGLEPFLTLAGTSISKRKWPLSLILGLLALFLLCAALAEPKGREPATWHLWDASWSHLGPGEGTGVPSEDSKGTDVILGGPDEFLNGRLLLDEILLAPSRSWIVHTDQPEPRGLPSHIQWQQTPRQGFNAAILAVTSGAGGGTLHWMRVGLSGPWFLQMDDLRLALPREGERGEFRLPDRPFAQLRLLQQDGSAWQDDQPWDDAWRAPPPLLLPEEAHPSWAAAVHAWVPGVRIRVQGSNADSSWPLVLDSDPFQTLPEAEALAEVRNLLEPWIALGDQPRWESECRPGVEILDWPVGLPAQANPLNRFLARLLAGTAVLLIGVAWFLRGRGR